MTRRHRSDKCPLRNVPEEDRPYGSCFGWKLMIEQVCEQCAGRYHSAKRSGVGTCSDACRKRLSRG